MPLRPRPSCRCPSRCSATRPGGCSCPRGRCGRPRPRALRRPEVDLAHARVTVDLVQAGPSATSSPLWSTETVSTTSRTRSMSCSIRTIVSSRREPAQELAHRDALARGKAGARLVEEEDPRLEPDRERDLELAHLAVRELDARRSSRSARPKRAAFSSSGGGRGARRASCGASRSAALRPERGERQVLAHRQIAEGSRHLVGAAEPERDAAAGLSRVASVRTRRSVRPSP